jgi:hypothetical protein
MISSWFAPFWGQTEGRVALLSAMRLRTGNRREKREIAFASFGQFLGRWSGFRQGQRDRPRRDLDDFRVKTGSGIISAGVGPRLDSVPVVVQDHQQAAVGILRNNCPSGFECVGLHGGPYRIAVFKPRSAHEEVPVAAVPLHLVSAVGRDRRYAPGLVRIQLANLAPMRHKTGLNRRLGRLGQAANRQGENCEKNQNARSGHGPF